MAWTVASLATSVFEVMDYCLDHDYRVVNHVPMATSPNIESVLTEKRTGRR